MRTQTLTLILIPPPSVDGSVRTLNTSAFIFGHILNSYEEGTDIVIDLTWYEAGNATTLGWFNR